MELYLFDITPLEDSSVFGKYYDRCPPAYQKKINVKKMPLDKCHILGGAILLAEGLSRRGVDINEEKLLFTECGKPYIESGKAAFNISHSGEYVVAAFSDYTVGVDIEMHREIDFKIAERYFHPSEYERLCHVSDPEMRKKEFFGLWTKKESLLKAHGAGLFASLSSFDVSGMNNVMFGDTRYHFFEYNIQGYSLSICWAGDEKPPRIEKIVI